MTTKVDKEGSSMDGSANNRSSQQTSPVSPSEAEDKIETLIDNLLINLVDDWQNWLHNGKPGEGRILLIEAKTLLLRLINEAKVESYKKGYIDGGIGVVNEQG